MKVVNFTQIKDELINNMRRKMLIPVIGSGFTRGCDAYKGKVPSGKDYSEYMISKIAAQLSLAQAEIDSLKRDSFSNVSDIYHRAIPISSQKEYLKFNFTKVKLEDVKRKFLGPFWPYIYTLNIDDGIEFNSCYRHIVYSNRPIEKGIFDDFSCVIKLHGDVAEMLTYEDAKSEVFTQKQYVNSLKSNESLLKKLHHDSIYQNLIFIGCSLDDDYESNKPYLFFGKSLISKDHAISIPYFFISRKVTASIFDNLSTRPLQFIVGSGCSGKSYVLVDIACRIKNRDVFFFETKDRLTDQAFQDLTCKKNCVILADDTSLSDDQIEYFVSHISFLKENDVNVVIAVDKHNRAVNGILKLHEVQGDIKSGDIPQIPIGNKLNNQEWRQISPLLTAVSAGVFKETDTIVDNIINLSKELSEKNKYYNIVPRFDSVPEIAALIALATERKIYSARATQLELYDELAIQCKATVPLIDQESTWTFETSFDDNSSIKYVVNAEFWLCYQLGIFAREEKNHKAIVEAYKYIITRILSLEGTPNLLRGDKSNSYGAYILFDSINKIFYSNKTGGEHGLGLIREIYEGLNKLLSADPNYMHQRAKCYIKSAYFEKEQAKKLEYLDKAFRDANVAFQVFDSRYNEYHNEKIYISASHVLYTKALILSHKCYVNSYASVEDNTIAIHTLHNALSSPYNTYAFAKKDSFNYLNVVSKIICETIARKTLVSSDAYRDLEDLFQIISE